MNLEVSRRRRNLQSLVILLVALFASASELFERLMGSIQELLHLLHDVRRAHPHLQRKRRHLGILLRTRK